MLAGRSYISRWLLALVVGAIWFQVIAPGSLDPRHTSWTLFSKDMAQHYIGWEFYRNEPFKLPLGKLDNYSYPQGTSLLYTDSIPVAGIVFKALNPLLPDNFQYFGIWLFASLVLQAYFGLTILGRVTSNPLLAVLGASLLLLTPSLLYRVFSHLSLASHWLILWGLALLYNSRDRAAGFSWHWPVLFFLASGIHLYFVPMLLILFGATLVLNGLNGRKPTALLIELGSNLFLLVGFNLLLGSFTIGWSNLNIGGLGYYSMNLIAPFDPMQFSRFLPELPKATPGQYEGFNYLGLGNLILLICCIPIVVQTRMHRKLHKSDLVILGVSGLFTLLASSNHITLGSRELFIVPLPAGLENVYGIFRSTGRFFWPVSYILIFAILALVLKHLRPAIATALLSLVLLAQMADISNLPDQIHKMTAYRYEDPLHSNFWQMVPLNFSKIILYPAALSQFEDTYEPVALLAARKHLKLNMGYLAREPVKEKSRQARQEFRKMLSGKGDANTLFIIYDLNELDRIKNDGLVVLQIDGYTVLFKKDHSILQNMPGWQQHLVPLVSPP